MPTILLTAQSAKRDVLRGRVKAAGFTLRESAVGPRSSEDDIIEALTGVDAVIAGVEPYTERVLSEAVGLRVIARCGVGYDSVDIDAATRVGVAVCTSPGANDRTVADFTVMVMLTLARRLVDAHQSLMSGTFQRPSDAIDLFGKVVGIIGTGAIGRQVARRLHAFDCQILAFDSEPDAGWASSLGVTYMDLPALLTASDFVTLHVPLAEATKNLIDEQALGLMKRTAFLINTARGPIVDQDALAEALGTRKIAGAAIDVFRAEPLERNSPLLTLDNVILTPHAAGGTVEADQRLSDTAVENATRALTGRPPVHCINPAVLERT